MKSKTFRLLSRMMVRTIKQNLMQFIAIIAIGAIAVTLFVGLHANAIVFEDQVNQVYEEGNLADLWVTTKSYDERDFDYIKSLLKEDEMIEFIKASLEENKMQVFVLGTGEKIINQYPEKGSKLYPGSTVVLLTDTYDKKIPNLIGLSYKDATNILKLMGVRYTTEGKGYVTNQSIAPDSIVTEDMTVTIQLN